MNAYIVLLLIIVILVPIVYLILKAIYKNSVIVKVALVFIVSISGIAFTIAVFTQEGYQHLYWALPVDILIFFSALYFIASLLQKPLNNLDQMIKNLSSGNIENTVNQEQLSRNDEFGRVFISIRELISKLTEVIAEVQNYAELVSESGNQMNASAEQVSQGANEQASTVEEVSSSMEEMLANIQMNSDNSQETEKIAKKASDNITKGSREVMQTVDSMKYITDRVSIINEIAFQTNLLALNAAVEAARAGEHGRGFAVVAAEVRKLAERSQNAALKIDEISKSSLEVAEKAGSNLKSIVPEIQKTSKLIQEIAAASQEQNSGAEQVNNAIVQLNRVTQQNASVSEEMASHSQNLTEYGNKLKKAIQFFRIKK